MLHVALLHIALPLRNTARPHGALPAPHVTLPRQCDTLRYSALAEQCATAAVPGCTLPTPHPTTPGLANAVLDFAIPSLCCTSPMLCRAGLCLCRASTSPVQCLTRLRQTMPLPYHSTLRFASTLFRVALLTLCPREPTHAGTPPLTKAKQCPIGKPLPDERFQFLVQADNLHFKRSTDRKLFRSSQGNSLTSHCLSA